MPGPLIRILVVLFLVFDVVLGVLAWQHVRGGQPTSESTGNSTSRTRAPDVFLPDTGTSEGTDKFQTSDPSTATMLDASDRHVVVATAGDCDGVKPTVMISEDGGQHFAPVKPDVSRVLAVNVRTSGTVDIVGADDACEAIGLTSTDNGATWKSNGVGTDWYRDSQSATGVALQGTTFDAGCEVMAVSGVTTGVVRVSCADGSVRGSDDAGNTWTTMGGIKAVRAVSFGSAATGVALVQTDNCSVSTFVTADGGDTWDQRGCIDGQVGHAVLDEDDRIVASVDATVSESDDGGVTWEAQDGS